MCSPLGTKNHSTAKEKKRSMWLESKAKKDICRRWAWEAHGSWKPSGRPSGHHSLNNQSEVKVKVTQPWPTLSDPTDCTSPWNSPGQNTGVGSLSLLQGIFPTQGLNPGLFALQADSLPTEAREKLKNTGVGSLNLLQQNFPTQKSNWGLLHCRWILYQLSYQGSPE